MKFYGRIVALAPVPGHNAIATVEDQFSNRFRIFIKEGELEKNDDVIIKIKKAKK